MSIFPATDIVSGVARAADPEKLRVATKLLTGVDPGNSGFTQGLDARAARAVEGQTTVVSSSARSNQTSEAAPSGLQAVQKFEAFLLQNWLEILLPSKEGGSYGSGASGNVWRSMMAEQLGMQIARSGGLGLQKTLEQWGRANS